MPDGISVGVGANNARLRTGLADSKKRIGAFSKSAEKSLSAGITKGFATSALVGGTFGVVLDNILNKYDDIAKAAVKANIDPEVFQKQAHAFDNAGVSMEQYVAVLGRMTRSAEEAVTGNAEVSESFAALGVDVEQFKKLAPDQAVLVLADAYAAATDKGKALNAMSKILGRSAQELIPAFAGGAQAIQEAGDKLKNVATADDLARVEEYNDALSDLTANFQGLLVKVVRLPKLLDEARIGWLHFLDTILVGQEKADKLAEFRLSGLSPSEFMESQGESLMNHLPEEARRRALAREPGSIPSSPGPTLSELANADNPFAQRLAMMPLVSQGSVAPSAPGLSGDPVAGTLRQISIDIAKLANTGVQIQPNPADY